MEIAARTVLRFNAFSRGVDVRIVATGHAEPPSGRTGNPVVVRKDLWDSGAVRNVPDLRGRSVAINGPAGGGEYTLGGVLRDHGVRARPDPCDVEEPIRVRARVGLPHQHGQPAPARSPHG